MTDSPNWVNNLTTSVEYRFLSSMQGSLGVGANRDKWTPDDFAVAKDMIAAYKQVRETVQHGSLYRLISPQEAANIPRRSLSRSTSSRLSSSPFCTQSERLPPPSRLSPWSRSHPAIHLRFIHGAKALVAPEFASGSY
jgi:alpha-galactosidase